jgi:microcompartment protein CcmK/EutM
MLIRKFINKVWDTVADNYVTWPSYGSPDYSGADYPGPGVYGVNTSHQCVVDYYLMSQETNSEIVQDFNKIYWVDLNIVRNSADGSQDNPFSSIQDALTAVGTPASLEEQNEEIAIIIKAGTYTENLIIPYGRNITFIAIPSYDSYVTIDGNVTWNIDGDNEFEDSSLSVRFTALRSFDPSTKLPDIGPWNVTGTLATNIISNGTLGHYDLVLDGFLIEGTVTVGDIYTSLLVWVNGSAFDSLVTIFGLLYKAYKTNFGGGIIFSSYGLIEQCHFWTSIECTTGYFPGLINAGFVYCAFDTVIPPTFNFPADNLLIDDVTLYNAEKALVVLPSDLKVLSTAFHQNIPGEIANLTEKPVPVAADLLLINDSEDDNSTKYVQISNLPFGSGTDPDAIHDNVAAEINALTEKTDVIGADLLLIEDSEDSNNKKKIQISNLPGGSGTDPDAIHDNVAAEISALTEKTDIVGADLLLIEDSEDSNNKKKAQISNLPFGAGTDENAIHDNVASEISALTEKTELVDADLVIIEDSADSYNKKKVQVVNLPGSGGGGGGLTEDQIRQLCISTCGGI